MAEPALHVRHARPRDLDLVAELWAGITRHHEPLEPVFAMRDDSMPAVRELLDTVHYDPDATIFVYEDEGDLPGMCIVRIDHAPPIMRESKRAEITDLGVRADARRQGIGRALVEAAFEWIRSRAVERVEVQVARGNEEGQAFWRAIGFADLMDVLHRRL